MFPTPPADGVAEARAGAVREAVFGGLRFDVGVIEAVAEGFGEAENLRMAVPGTPFVADGEGFLGEAGEFVFGDIAAGEPDVVEAEEAGEFFGFAEREEIASGERQMRNGRIFFNKFEGFAVNDEPPVEAFFERVHRGPAGLEFGHDGVGVEGRDLVGVVVECARVVVAHVRAGEGEGDGVAVQDDEAEALAEEVVEDRAEVVGGPTGFDDGGGFEFFFPVVEEGR